MLRKAMPLALTFAGLALVVSGAKAQFVGGSLTGLGGASALSVGMHSPFGVSGPSSLGFNNVTAFSGAPLGVFQIGPGTGYATVVPLNNFIPSAQFALPASNLVGTGFAAPVNSFVGSGFTAPASNFAITNLPFGTNPPMVNSGFGTIFMSGVTLRPSFTFGPPAPIVTRLGNQMPVFAPMVGGSLPFGTRPPLISTGFGTIF